MLDRLKKEEEEGVLQLERRSSLDVKQMMRGLLPIGTEEREVEEVPGSLSEQRPVVWGLVAAVAVSSSGHHAFLVYDLVLIRAIPHLHTAADYFVAAAAGIGECPAPV